MTIEHAAAAEESVAAVPTPRGTDAGSGTRARRKRLRLRLITSHQHDWRLRDVEYVDGFCVRRFECDGCGEVNFS